MATLDQPGKYLSLGVGDAVERIEVPRWLAAIVVTIATWGCTMPTSGVISPAWFMPISNTPKAVSRGMRASVSGTPQ